MVFFFFFLNRGLLYLFFFRLIRQPQAFYKGEYSLQKFLRAFQIMDNVQLKLMLSSYADKRLVFY